MNSIGTNDLVTLPTHVIPSAPSHVFFDIETGGFRRTCDILQIAAACGKETFDVYITPEQYIDPIVASFNKITLVEGVMHYNDQPVTSVPLEVGMKNFLVFLESFPEPRIVIGHNIRSFDCPFINNAMVKLDLMNRFSKVVTGFIDTLRLYKDFMPKPMLENHKQSTIVQAVLNESYEEHNALADVLSLQKVFNFSNFPEDMLKKHFFSHSYFTDLKIKKEAKLKYDLKIKDFKAYGLPLRICMVRRIVKAELGYDDIKNAFINDGKQGILELFVGPDHEHPRVTKTPGVINDVFQYFVNKNIGPIPIS